MLQLLLQIPVREDLKSNIRDIEKKINKRKKSLDWLGKLWKNTRRRTVAMAMLLRFPLG